MTWLDVFDFIGRHYDVLVWSWFITLSVLVFWAGFNSVRRD